MIQAFFGTVWSQPEQPVDDGPLIIVVTTEIIVRIDYI